MFDPVAALQAAGVPVDQLNAGQRGVLAALSPEETEVLVAVTRKLSAAEGEVVAHSSLKLL